MSRTTDKKAKEKIIDSALELFYYKGFNGTTIRQIAAHAEVNQALISYYFGGKKGLLEALMVRFYEGYFKSIDPISQEGEKQQSVDQLIQMLQTAYDYLFEHYKMTRFIYRELTMDSMLIREVMTTYLSKERYYYSRILDQLQEQGQLPIFDVDMMVLQLVHILYMPFLQPQAIREVYYIEPISLEFKERYFSQLKQWTYTFLELK